MAPDEVVDRLGLGELDVVFREAFGSLPDDKVERPGEGECPVGDVFDRGRDAPDGEEPDGRSETRLPRSSAMYLARMIQGEDSVLS